MTVRIYNTIQTAIFILYSGNETIHNYYLHLTNTSIIWRLYKNKVLNKK